jgi:hypothetical protein
MRFLIPFTVLLAAGGCGNDRVASLEKQVKELQDQVAKQQAAELQSKCSDDGAAYLSRQFPADPSNVLLTHNTHYRKSSNQCWMLVENHVKQSGKTRSWFTHMYLYDVSGNAAHGKLSILHDIREPDLNDVQSVVACEVAGAKCGSLDEFTRQTQPYMSN